MLTRIDHVMICVPDLGQGIDAYTRMGFRVHPGDTAIAFFQEDYLELASGGGGFRYVVVQSNDLAADVAAMRQRGVEVSDPTEDGRHTPAGQELRWNIATLGPRNPLPIVFIQHLTPLD
ncbi:MAG: VOC family protein, partial [Dehalococcoidia bacterium]|nr:VOC family protein [Dehalococcoidia bacterium]